MTISEILALASDSSPRLIFATDEEKFYYIAAGAAGSTATWIANGADGGGDFLPLAGGTMDDNATILWDNASAIREAGDQGLEIECSVGYRWQWVSGRMIMRQVNSGQIARIIAIDGINPSATDDETQGFVIGTRWETVDGIVYVCTDATTDAAVWLAADILASDLTPSIDATNRQLIAADGLTTTLDWSDEMKLTLFGSSGLGGYDLVQRDNGELELLDSTSLVTVRLNSRQLIASDGSTVMLDWNSNTGIDAYAINTAQGYTTQGDAAHFPYGLTMADGESIYWATIGTGAYIEAAGSVGSSSITMGNVDAINMNAVLVANYGLYVDDLYDQTTGLLRIDLYNQTIHTNSGAVEIDWASGYLGGGYTDKRVAWQLAELQGYNGSSFIPALNWGTRQLIASDGSTIAADWSTGTPAFAQGASYTPTEYVSLPASPVEGTVCYVNDADSPVSLGSVVTGGGPYKILACFDGTDWKVIAHLA